MDKKKKRERNKIYSAASLNSKDKFRLKGNDWKATLQANKTQRKGRQPYL